MKPAAMRLHWPWLGRVAVLCALALAGCGGGGGEPRRTTEGAAACDLPTQQQWLRAYMQDWYYWAGVAPDPAPQGYDSIGAYFTALLYPGDGSGAPEDRWSYRLSTASYARHFGAGQSLGWGLSVSGLEGLPLKVRHVEPNSPAAAAGVVRGDEVLAVNGRPAAELVAAHDFSALEAGQVGDTVTLNLATAQGERRTTLRADVFALSPVPASGLLALPDGRQAGYLMLKDFIDQARAPLQAALAQFRSAGTGELIVDLRYNGGGLVSTAAELASLIVGAAHAGQPFVQLRYNARHPEAARVYALASQPGPTFERVVVITGPRTCSASELLINGLRPYARVTTIGTGTCGKPFGFSPVQSCGDTINAVNFETFNAAGQGRYYGGIEATCTAAEDFERPLGDPAEKLTAAALTYLQTQACPATSAADRERAASLRLRRGVREPGEWRGMWAD